MQIKDFLSASEVVVDFPASDKADLLRGLATRAASTLKLPGAAVVRSIQVRDELGSTGIGNGVCIPHARLQQLKRPFGLLARLKQPIAYQAIDDQPVDIVFLLLLPAAPQSDQLNVLAAVARKLRDQAVLRRARSATGATELYQALAG